MKKFRRAAVVGGALIFISSVASAEDSGTCRSDFMADSQGQRTSFKGDFLESDLGYTHWVGDALELRPELRLERQLTAPNASITGYACDNPCPPSDASNGLCTLANGAQIPSTFGTRNQAMIAAEAIFHF
jgi:hypothetical protein